MICLSTLTVSKTNNFGTTPTPTGRSVATRGEIACYHGFGIRRPSPLIALKRSCHGQDARAELCQKPTLTPRAQNHSGSTSCHTGPPMVRKRRRKDQASWNASSTAAPLLTGRVVRGEVLQFVGRESP